MVEKKRKETEIDFFFFKSANSTTRKKRKGGKITIRPMCLNTFFDK
jgi:hypothetical protein